MQLVFRDLHLTRNNSIQNSRIGNTRKINFHRTQGIERGQQVFVKLSARGSLSIEKFHLKLYQSKQLSLSQCETNVQGKKLFFMERTMAEKSSVDRGFG